ncbi:MAG: hypothetical protein KatS3mg105_1803 [Gemmatales bacterium]|nr:MAG: hypothetical protein KatS3mg105_1803 [Gemmatales bacterium]
MINAPPRKPPQIAVHDDGGLHRLERKLQILCLTAMTVFGSVWLLTYGYVPGMVGLVVAKHVLVAILAMGLGLDEDFDSPFSLKRKRMT